MISAYLAKMKTMDSLLLMMENMSMTLIFQIYCTVHLLDIKGRILKEFKIPHNAKLLLRKEIQVEPTSKIFVSNTI